MFRFARERAWRCVGWTLIFCLLLATIVGAEDAPVRRASELMKNHQYHDAIKVLSEEVKGKADEAAARPHLMLGECHYLLKQYEEARGYFAKAARNAADDADKAVAEYRLAGIAFRLKETNSASERIDAFVTKRPGDARVGVLLVFKMRLLADKGAAAEREMVALHERIVGESRKYGAAAAMESDEVLCEFYRGIGQEEKAIGLYGRIVNNYRRMIADLEKEKQPVPAAYEQTHDNASLQLGLINLEKKQYGEATKWLENVAYDGELKLRAKLLLSKMAYEKGDYAQVIARLTEKNLLADISDGPTKWDVCLLLGLAERARPDSNAGKVEEWLKQVGQQARGFGQAQGVLGDLYREKGLQEEALRAYAAVMASPDHAVSATYWTATIYLERAAKEPEKAVAAELTKKATEMLGRVLQAYPMSSSAKLAKETLAELAKKGVDVGAAAGADEMLRAWERIATDKPGTADAAQALAQLVRVHAKMVLDEKTRKPSRGPNYVAMAAVADRLLDEKTYKGDGLSEAGWRALRCEVLYQRALAELASMNPSKELEAVGAVYLKHPSADAAAEWLRQARKLVEPKQLEMVKGIDLSLLEALFKSESPENREKAEKRFGELEADYGSDPRFAKLSLDLAEFYKSKGRFVEAAEQYAGAARRGRDLPAEDAVKLWYTAGTLYSRAAYEMQQKKSQRDYGVYLYPRETISFGMDDAVRADGRMGREVAIHWPRGGSNVTAKEALLALSKASGVAFVWPTARGQSTIANYLDTQRLTLKDGKYTVEQALDMVLDGKTHRVALDIGLADGTPTRVPTKAAGDEPADAAIEVYDVRQEASRLKGLARNYGAWRNVHGSPSGRDAGVMFYDVVQRIEQLSGTRMLWVESVDKQAKLGVEIREKDLGGLSPNAEATCAAILGAVTEKAGLRFRIVARDLGTKFYEDANKAFNEARKIDPTGKYAEKSLFAVAVNYYNLRDYPKMKQVLKTYLKLFDNPDNETYQQACFWIGYALEMEKKQREAVNYYARAAEERLIIAKAADGEGFLPQKLKEQLSYDSQFALSEPLRGKFEGMSLSQFADFVQVNTHVGVRIDPAVRADVAKIDREAFKDASGLALLAEVLGPAKLTCRVENVNAEVAEKAYFRMAAVYKRDNLMEQALENCNLLLGRYPKTERRRDVSRLMLDIYKGMGDYAKVIGTLEELRKTATDAEEIRDLALETASIYFDMADYEKAAAAYRSSLGLAKGTSQLLGVWENYARSLARLGKTAEALAEYQAIIKEETGPLASFVDSMIVFQLKYALGQALEREFPEDALKYLLAYEKLSDQQQERMSNEQKAKVTWTYYVLGMVDLDKKRVEDAVVKLSAARNSPDDALAGEAAVRVGMIYVERGEWAKAKEAFETLLFQARASDARVRGTYWLGVCLEKLGDSAGAAKRFTEVVTKYPASPYAGKAREHEANKDGGKEQVKP